MLLLATSARVFSVPFSSTDGNGNILLLLAVRWLAGVCSLAKFDSETTRNKLSFLTTLRSTGQQKYAVDDRDSTSVIIHHQPYWAHSMGP